MNPKTEFQYLILEAAEAHGLEVVRELELVEERKFALDLAIPSLEIGFEYEGLFSKAWFNPKTGRFVPAKSGHLTPEGYSNNCEKYSIISGCLGWRLVRITPIMVSDGRAGPLIRGAIEAALAESSEGAGLDSPEPGESEAAAREIPKDMPWVAPWGDRRGEEKNGK